MKTRLKSLVFSIDVLAAILTAAGLYLWHPAITSDLAQQVFGVGLAVLATVFSVFFAALAILMASSDDEFAHYLVKKGHYANIMFIFDVSLRALFTALLLSTILFVANLPATDIDPSPVYSPFVFTVYCALVAYSLVSAYQATKAAMLYTSYRQLYLSTIRPSSPDANQSPSVAPVRPDAPSDAHTSSAARQPSRRRSPPADRP